MVYFKINNKIGEIAIIIKQITIKYFIFNSTFAGMLEFHAIHTKQVYTAPVSVKWGTNQLTIIQHGDAVSSKGDKIYKDDFVCRPNKERLLETSCQRNGKERYTFLLEKVN